MMRSRDWRTHSLFLALLAGCVSPLAAQEPDELPRRSLEVRQRSAQLIEAFVDQEAREHGNFEAENYLRFVEDDLRARLSAAVPAEARRWCDVRELLVRGKAYREILRLAEERQAEVVVLGVHGRNPVDLMLFGSTTHHVVRGAACPVLTIRG